MTKCDNIKPSLYRTMIIQYFCMADSGVIITPIPKNDKKSVFGMVYYMYVVIPIVIYAFLLFIHDILPE